MLHARPRLTVRQGYMAPNPRKPAPEEHVYGKLDRSKIAAQQSVDPLPGGIYASLAPNRSSK